MYQSRMESPIGSLRLVESEGFLKEISLEEYVNGHLGTDGRIIKRMESYKDAIPEKTPLLKETERQLNEYFAGVRKCFDLPLKPDGTAFFQAVWKRLLEIPYGETCTYGEIAADIGKPKAARAVGMANHHNPIMIVIPCHRVIGANGKMVGYAGGIDIKEKLLSLENEK